MTTFAIIVTCLLAVSEALANIPTVKANSMFQLLYNILISFSGKPLKSMLGKPDHMVAAARKKASKKPEQQP